MFPTESTSRTKPHRAVRTGVSVGHKESDATTIGDLVKRTDELFIGLTAGHLVEQNYTDSNLTQPSPRHLDDEIQELDEKIRG